MTVLAVAGLCLALAAQAADQSPRVATLYSAFKDGCVHVLVKRHAGRDWILTVNTSAQAVPQLSIPVGAGAAEVEVLFESRRLPMHGAAITDGFLAHGTHTYLIQGSKTTR